MIWQFLLSIIPMKHIIALANLKQNLKWFKKELKYTIKIDICIEDWSLMWVWDENVNLSLQSFFYVHILWVITKFVYFYCIYMKKQLIKSKQIGHLSHIIGLLSHYTIYMLVYWLITNYLDDTTSGNELYKM